MKHVYTVQFKHGEEWRDQRWCQTLAEAEVYRRPFPKD
jgi:hypothetical protein